MAPGKDDDHHHGHHHDHSRDHTHSHGHDHEYGSELSEDAATRARAQSILTEKGYGDSATLDAIIEAYETKIGPRNGAHVVAKAWTDPAFKRALLEDGSKTIGTLGHVSRVGDHLVVVENTPERHNMIVCTLCSCYPWEMLGLPPIWYKSAPYRSRAVKDPRGGSKISASPCRRKPKLASGTRPPRHASLCSDAARWHRG
jgi:nitrile hydratase